MQAHSESWEPHPVQAGVSSFEGRVDESDEQSEEESDSSIISEHEPDGGSEMSITSSRLEPSGRSLLGQFVHRTEVPLRDDRLIFAPQLSHQVNV